jgi:CheY-like chemotaxis protein
MFRPSPPPCIQAKDPCSNQKVLAKQLRNNGYRVSVTNHGLECLSFIETTKFWTANNGVGEGLMVILMDWEMPIMDGLTCVRRIRELEREGKITGHVPVVAVTANARSQQRRAAEEAGMDDVVTKPYRVSEILEQVSGVLERLERTK